MPNRPPAPAFRDALGYWLKLGFISFGGPAGQIALMHRELVERRRWISEGHFLHALNFCMLLPGPEAQQLATYLGWRMHGARGGIAAGALFVLPSVLIMLALSWLYMVSGRVPWLAAVFYGLLPAVIAVVAAALLRISSRALQSPALWGLAAASFVAIFFFKVHFIIIILAAALTGWTGSYLWPRQFPAGKHHTGDGHGEDAFVAVLRPPPVPSWKRTAGILVVTLGLWWVPVLLAGWLLGADSTPFRQGVFFSQAALVTFGGAYAVLPYVAEQAVGRYGWLTYPQMTAGLGLAETTPGPLIMVLQFVGFAGGWQNPGDFRPETAAVLCALMTTWVTFLPCFLFVFLGGPSVERLRDQPRLGAALTAITAAVVGVMLNLAVFFAHHALWPHGWQAGVAAGGIDWFVLVTGIAAFIALRKYNPGAMMVTGVCALLGVVWKTVISGG